VNVSRQNLSDRFRISLRDTFLQYSDILGGWPGLGNINEDPLFIYPETLNFQLQENSPCIDSGIDSILTLRGETVCRQNLSEFLCKILRDTFVKYKLYLHFPFLNFEDRQCIMLS
jgi:hypothetical protein